MSEIDDKLDGRMERLVRGLREEYNAPPATPREEMWGAIEARLAPRAALDEGKGGSPESAGARSMDSASGGPDVISLDAAREARAIHRPTGIRRPLAWAAAAAAVLVVGVGIGRMTAPGVAPEMGGVAAAESDPSILRAAALEHLLRTESLLTMVRADARSGRVEPTVGTWAESLLTETRLLLDAQGGDADPTMRVLLEDLELVLAQIVGVANARDGDEARARSELVLALDGIEKREVLPRIQAVVPAGPGFVGT